MIKLTRIDSDNTTYLNPSGIESLELRSDGSGIVGESGVSYVVKEKGDDILAALKELGIKVVTVGEKEPVTTENINLNRMSKDELIAFAKKKKIKVDPKLNKDDLIGQIYEGLGE